MTTVPPPPADPAFDEEVVPPPAPQEERLHDLDALRGVAMILGVVLHASLAYFPAFWAVQDSGASADSFIDELEQAIHGFRMPLFFLLSGFFTAMLWRRRGWASLARQRALRILVPLAIGTVTILPLMDAVVDRAVANGAAVDVVRAVADDDADTIRGLLDSGIDVTESDGDREGGTLLHLAAYLGSVEVVEVLLEAGMPPDVRQEEPTDPDGQTPLDLAIVAGHADVADVLVAAGAQDLRPPGDDWDELPFWAAFPPGDELAEEGGGEGEDEDEGWLDSLDHLWFLWYLTILVAGFLAVAAVLDAVTLPTGAHRAGTVVMWSLIPLSWVAHRWMVDDVGYIIFGPHTSTSPDPSWPIVAFYATFFAFGAFAYGRTGPDGRPVVRTVGRSWPVSLGLAMVVFLPLGLGAITDGSGETVEVALLWQAAFAWLTIFGLMGLFHRFLGTERRGVRYLSDSAYWLYLAHLPLVIYLQDELREWDAAIEVKFLTVVAVASVLLLVSYQLFVRYTPIGWSLNGRRTPTRMNLPWAEVPGADRTS